MGANYGRAGGALQFARRWQRHALRLLIAVVLAAMLIVAALLADALGLFPQPMAAPSASGAPSAFYVASQTTRNKLAPEPTLSLLSPSSGQGPVGATLSVSGQNFTASAVTIFAAQDSSCATPVQNLGSAQPNGGSFTTTFQWPNSLSNGSHPLCATGMTATTVSYSVLSSSPPVLSLSTSSVSVGQPLTVTGSNFTGLAAGQSVLISLKASGTTQQLSNQTPNGGGSFSWTYTPDGYVTGPVTLIATSPIENNAPQPALSATANFTVTPGATPTATTGATATAGATTTAGAGAGVTSTGTSTGGSGGGGAGLLVILAIIITLIVLIALGVAAYFLLRGRNGADGQGGNQQQGPGYGSPSAPGYGGYDGYGGYGAAGRGSAPGYGQSGPGRYGSNPQQGRSGFYEPDPYANVPVGGVAQWDDRTQGGPTGETGQWDNATGQWGATDQWGAAPNDSVPGPDWQPRPMSGTRRHYDDPGYPQQYPGGQGYGQGDVPPTGAYPPVDPWDSYSGGPGAAGNAGGYGGGPQGGPPGVYGGDPSGAYGGGPSSRGQGSSTRQPPQSSGQDGWDAYMSRDDGRGRPPHPSGPGPDGRRSAPNRGDDGWGPGGTNPTNNRDQW